MQYREPKIVLFESVTQSGCGTAESSMGPFYCPADETVYMDMSSVSYTHLDVYKRQLLEKVS